MYQQKILIRLFHFLEMFVKPFEFRLKLRAFVSADVPIERRFLCHPFEYVDSTFQRFIFSVQTFVLVFDRSYKIVLLNKKKSKTPGGNNWSNKII